MPQPPALWLVLLLLATPVQALELAEGSNEPLPPLRFYDMQGNKTGLESFRGKVVVLNLWATWCVPCREEMPSLDRMAAQLDPKDAVVVGLSVDRAGPERVQMFLDDIGVTRLLIFRDPWGLAPRDLKVPGLPATILVDRAGREVGRLLGIAEWDSPEALAVVREIIGRPGSAGYCIRGRGAIRSRSPRDTGPRGQAVVTAPHGGRTRPIVGRIRTEV